MDPSHLSEALRRLWWWVRGVDRSTDSTLCARCRPWTNPEKLEHARILYLHSNKTAADVCRPVGDWSPNIVQLPGADPKTGRHDLFTLTLAISKCYHHVLGFYAFRPRPPEKTGHRRLCVRILCSLIDGGILGTRRFGARGHSNHPTPEPKVALRSGP